MDEKKEAERYFNGFNDGYLLSRYDPALMKKIGNLPTEGNPYFDGMNSGRIAHEREVYMQNLEKNKAKQTQNHKPKIR